MANKNNDSCEFVTCGSGLVKCAQHKLTKLECNASWDVEMRKDTEQREAAIVISKQALGRY